MKSSDFMASRSAGIPPENLSGLPADLAPLWRQLLDGLAIGLAVLDARHQRTLWLNAALQALLETAVAKRDVLDLHPLEYLPNLDKARWDQAMAALSADMPGSHRLQFVHQATRNITYWEWSVRPADDNAPPRYLLLTVQSVSEVVMNERMLASEARKADRARNRAEALGRLTQWVNASLTPEEMLRAVTHEAAAFFDTPHAAVLLRNADTGRFAIGYSIGLRRPESDSLLENERTLASTAIQERKTIALTNTARHDIALPQMEDDSIPGALVVSPICHNENLYGVVEVYFKQPRDFPEEGIGLLSAFADQTAVALHRYELYDQIAEQRRQLQSVFDHAPVGIVYFDRDMRIVAANAAAKQNGPLLPEAQIGQHINAFEETLPHAVLESARDGKPFHASHYVHRLAEPQDGGERVSDLSLLPVRDDSGRVAGVLLLSYDITESVKARQEADAARAAAESALNQARAAQAQMVQLEKMRAIGELASGVAHDFNNALQTILGYTELAQDSLNAPEELTGQLAVIEQAALDASSTVRRLQRFARQRVAANGEPTDVNAIVQDVLGMTRPRWRDTAQKEGRTYTIRTNLEAVPLVLAEPSGLREALVNLIHNALNAMPEGGILTLETGAQEDSRVEIRVRDTGIGMTPEVIARIFDPFFTTRGVEGTGLGLAVSWTIMQRHGGTIDVQSAPGQGSCFTLRLPVHDETAAPQPAAIPQAALHPLQARLLVVDDEPFVASVLTSILTRHGHQVTVAHSAMEALERLHSGSADYDLLLTDHGMPGMTGLQLVEEVKRLAPGLPVLLLTGWGENLLQTHVASALPDAVLGKPINQSDLLDAIARLLRERPGAEFPEAPAAADSKEIPDPDKGRT